MVPMRPMGKNTRERQLERIERVRKRDGRSVPFHVEKIAQAIEAAMTAVGEPDPTFAAEVASVVELTLLEAARNAGADVHHAPGIEEIQDLVERALMELGRPNVAKAYILYRDQRARIRKALRVHRPGANDALAALKSSVRVRENEGVSPWSKGRLVGALIEEAELPREVAEDVAAAVERRVFASGLTRITTALVRELVAAELLDRGWTNAVSSLGIIGLSRHDLSRVLRDEPLDAWEREMGERDRPARPPDPCEAVSGEVLRRYGLEELLPAGADELHRSGEVHVEDLRAPHRALTLCVEAELLASGGHSVTSAQAVLEGAAELVRDVSRVLVLERPADVLAPLLRAARPGSPLGLGGWLRSLAAIARAGGVRIDLGSPGPRSIAFTARLVEALVELPPGPHAPALYLEAHELEALLAEHAGIAADVDRLMGEGRLFSTWDDGEEVFAGPGCRRRKREPGVLSCGGAVAINLPRLARRAGAWREDLVQSGIVELVQAALEIARSLESFQSARDKRHPRGFHTRRSWAIVPVGLREALLHLGDGVVDPDLGARLLGLVAEAAGRFAVGSLSTLVPVAPSPFFGERAARRFAWLDEARAREEAGEQRWLFADADGQEAGAPRPYTAGFRLSPLPGTAAGRHEADALRTISSGALSLVGLPGLGDWTGSADERPYLSAWRRFEVLRRAGTGEVVLELFPTHARADETTLRPVN